MALYQQSLFTQPTRVKIMIDEDHELVRLTHLIDWGVLIEIAKKIRTTKIIKGSGPAPHYRELLGAIALMAVKKITFREAEDMIAHYGPAKYLCNLMDSDWRIDHVTIFDFTEMLGPEGMEEINGEILKIAHQNGFADPKEMMSDTTAQEAKISYPNEVGLMARYTKIIKKNVKKAGQKFQNVKKKIKKVDAKIKGLVRNAHLFAKTKEAKQKVAKKLYHAVDGIHREVKKVLKTGKRLRSKASMEITRITDVMERLLPQMRYFIETGFVASKKIIHLQMSELYAIVRGKAGKKVEFGIKWGVNRIRGGFVQGFLINGGKHVSDKKFCAESVKVHKETFGKVPDVFGFDRGGYSEANIKKIKKMKVKHVGIAPKGNSDWHVSETMKERIKRERAQVEGCIGTVKSPRYGFNKPDARSVPAMATYGHRAFIGFNMRKLVREILKQQQLATT